MSDIIVIVSGQEFTVPAGTEPEQIRQALVANFPDVANATIKRGKKKLGEIEHDTIEFEKKAGTKGAGLADLLASVPPATLPDPTSRAVDRLLAGELTFADAERLGVAAAVESIGEGPAGQQGAKLCERLDSAPIAAAQPRGW